MLMVAVSLTMMAFGMKGGRRGVHRPCDGRDERGALCRAAYRRYRFRLRGHRNPDRGHDRGAYGFIIAGSLLILKGLDDFVLQPTLYSERVKAHPLEIFLVILIAGSMAGILGMLLAIPSYTVLRVFAKEFFSQFRLVRKLTEKI